METLTLRLEVKRRAEVIFFMIRAVLRVSSRIPDATYSSRLSNVSNNAPLAYLSPLGTSRAVLYQYADSSRQYSTIISPLHSFTRVGQLVHLPHQLTRIIFRFVSNKQRKRWKIRKYHFKLRLKRTMRRMRVPYVSSKARGQAKKKPILYDFRALLRRKLKRAER